MIPFTVYSRISTSSSQVLTVDDWSVKSNISTQEPAGEAITINISSGWSPWAATVDPAPL